MKKRTKEEIVEELKNSPLPADFDWEENGIRMTIEQLSTALDEAIALGREEERERLIKEGKIMPKTPTLQEQLIEEFTEGLSTGKYVIDENWLNTAFSKLLKAQRREDKRLFVKKIRNWFEENFTWGDSLGDDVTVTEHELEMFIKTLTPQEDE